MALGMAAAVSEPRCPSAPGPAAGQVQAQPPPELTAAPSPPSFPPSLPAAALAGGGAATRGCALRPPGEPTPRSNNTTSAGRVRTKKKACSSEQSPDSLPLRSSGRQVKKKAAEATDDDDDASEKKYRKCEKAGCTATCPVCFASAAERCAKNGYTSRWYHLSCGEHFCNECFDHYYRSHKDGYEKYTAWKRIWTSNGKSEPSPKAFMADQQLPYWVQCTKPECGKWRQLTKEIQLTPQIAKTYKCGMKLNNSTKVTQKTFAHMETSNK